MADSVTQCKVCGSWGCKTCQNHHPSSNMFNTWYEVFDMCLVFTKHGIMSKNLHFHLISPKEIVPVLSFLLRCNFFWSKVLNITRVNSEGSMEVGG